MLEIIPVLALSSAIVAASPAEMPLKLLVNTNGGASVIRIVGESPHACTASYRLEVTDAGGGNRSVTSGNTMLKPGIKQTLATVAVGSDSVKTTVATLHVHLCNGNSYEEAWRG
jgi:hypothetical protein